MRSDVESYDKLLIGWRGSDKGSAEMFGAAGAGGVGHGSRCVLGGGIWRELLCSVWYGMVCKNTFYNYLRYFFFMRFFFLNACILRRRRLIVLVLYERVR